MCTDHDPCPERELHPSGSGRLCCCRHADHGVLPVDPAPSAPVITRSPWDAHKLALENRAYERAWRKMNRWVGRQS